MAARTAKAVPPVASPNRLAPSPGVGGLRRAIAEALESGAAAEALVLHLSRRDQALLKRSPDVAVHEIRFADGAMRFLDVRVSDTPVDVSRLDHSDAADAEAVA